MGYTHYFEHQAVSQEIWDKIVTDCKKLYENMPEHSESSGGYHNDARLSLNGCRKYGEEPCFSSEEIWFNGGDDLDHETFTLFRDGSGGFCFCKTARKPYDLMVQACLLVYKHYSPDTMDLGSDGDLSDWKVAQDFVEEVLGYWECPWNMDRDVKLVDEE